MSFYLHLRSPLISQIIVCIIISRNGGFYLVGWPLDDQVSFMHVDAEGKLSVIYDDFDYSLFNGIDKFDGKVKSLAFDGPEELIIVSTREGEIRTKSIPDNGLLYYQDFFWFESDNVSFVEIRNESGTYDTYMFTFESEPEIITSLGRSDRLIMVMEDSDSAILVYKDNNHILSFEKYTYASEEFEKLIQLPSVRNNFIDNAPLKISNSKYLLSLNDGLYGLEPWVFDLATENLELIKDLRTGFLSGKIEDYTINPINKEVYFSAIRDEGDRQLFKIDQSLLSTEQLYEKNSSVLRVFPSPAHTYIQLDQSYQNIQIIGTDGRIVIQNGPYLKGQQISTESFPNGMYFILAKTQKSEFYNGKFIVEK